MACLFFCLAQVTLSGFGGSAWYGCPMVEKDYRLGLARYAKQAFDALTPAEQRLLRQMMRDDPVHTPEEAKASTQRWFARVRARAVRRHSQIEATSAQEDAGRPSRSPDMGDVKENS